MIRIILFIFFFIMSNFFVCWNGFMKISTAMRDEMVFNDFGPKRLCIDDYTFQMRSTNFSFWIASHCELSDLFASRQNVQQSKNNIRCIQYTTGTTILQLEQFETKRKKNVLINSRFLIHYLQKQRIKANGRRNNFFDKAKDGLPLFLG